MPRKKAEPEVLQEETVQPEITETEEKAIMEQPTVDIHGNDTILKARGRHDPCVLPRAVPIVEAMAAMTILDYYLLNKTTRL